MLRKDYSLTALVGTRRWGSGKVERYALLLLCLYLYDADRTTNCQKSSDRHLIVQTLWTGDYLAESAV